MPGDKDSRRRPDQWRFAKPLGEALREQYKQVLNEPVPERLKKLIEELREKEEKERDGQKD